jgi:AraC-like DNA-binding protein
MSSNKNSLIRAAAFMGFADLLKELGADPTHIFNQVNISPAQLQNPENLVSSTAFVGALQYASEATQHPDFGLRLGARQDINMLGPIGMLAHQCHTVEEAFSVVGRYVNLHNPGALIELQTYNDKALLVYDDTTPGFPRNPQICDLALAIGVSAIRQVTGEQWAPKGMFFVHKEPQDTHIYRQVFNAPLYFDQPIYGMEFDQETLQITRSDLSPELKDFFTRYVAQLESEHASSSQSVVEKLIRSLLSSGHCTEARVAEIMQVNRRTIQRRLKAEKTSFKEILTTIRMELAKQYLRETNISLSDISAELGYSEPSAFMRFFKNQMGKTPMEYRRR